MFAFFIIYNSINRCTVYRMFMPSWTSIYKYDGDTHICQRPACRVWAQKAPIPASKQPYPATPTATLYPQAFRHRHITASFLFLKNSYAYPWIRHWTRHTADPVDQDMVSTPMKVDKYNVESLMHLVILLDFKLSNTFWTRGGKIRHLADDNC